MTEMCAKPPRPALARRLSTTDATVVGLGAMLGAGVFSAFGPAAGAAGAGLLVGLGIAAVVAYCNAVASAQLAAVYPVSGGTYVYGRERLGPTWGFVAGWGFVIGKTASCAAMALTFGAYAVTGPEWAQRLVGLAAVAVLTAANYRGVAKTALLTRILVAATLAVLGLVVGLALTGGTASPDHLDGWASSSPYDVLQAAGLLFFAFAGYARIATLGEEVRDPERAIPRAIVAALAIVVVVYVAIGVGVLLATGPDPIADAADPLAVAVDVAGAAWAEPVVRIGAAVASLGALLVLIAGVGRTSLAMAREGDLPRVLDAVHPRFRVPHHAELAVAVVVGVLVLTLDLRGVIGFSSFGVLTYYAVANASAFTQPARQRRWPRALNVLGLVGCVGLAFTLPPGAVGAGLAMFAIGLGGRAVVRRRAGLHWR
jgi:basic amino acid/polyamine antiporter, APA family